jgi:immune inhibitor A
MFRKLFNVLVVAVMVLGLGSYAPASVTASSEDGVWLGAQPMNGIHYRTPREDIVVRDLEEAGVLSADASPEQVKAAVADYYAKFQKKSDTWVNPQMEARALAREAGLEAADSNAPVKAKAQIMAMAIDFGAVNESITYEYLDASENCVQTTGTFSGPRQGELAAPLTDDPATPEANDGDNNTVWYTKAQTANPKFYENLIFGYKGAGRVRMDLKDPRDGKPGINLKGITVQDYYDRMSGKKGLVKLSGAVVGWVTVPHAEAYYGADTCNGNHQGGAFDALGNRVNDPQLVEDAVALFNAKNPRFNWAKYDMNKDGVIDNFWVIHAGAGQEADGGAQGDFSIWSHSTDARYYSKWEKGIQVAGKGTPSTADDLYIGPYTMQPENSDVGVMCEEFGHNLFGLPDLYVTSPSGAQGSIGFWSIMESGAWGGYLGGSQPVGMPLWFRMIADCNGVACGWDKPMLTRHYDDGEQVVNIGQLESTPNKMLKGVRIEMPRIFEEIPNRAGTGKGAYTGTGRDEIDITLTRSVQVPNVTSADTNLVDPYQLSVSAAWSIEKDWDYMYAQVNDGSGWVFMTDTSGKFVSTNPNGNNKGVGLTGLGSGTLTFNLAAYKGKTVDIRFRYVTDAASTEAGVWLDNLALGSTLLSDFDTTGLFSDWTNSEDGWMEVPMTKAHVNYYLVEWRNNTRYDGMTQTAYITTKSKDGIWRVSRAPYNIPGALVYYRNTKYPNTYNQWNNQWDLPSTGPKYQLLVVDMNPVPVRFFDPTTSAYLGYLNSRVSSYDAALTMQDSKAFTIPAINASPAPYVGPFNVAAKPAVKQFNDFYGYFPGYFTGAPCASLTCWTNRDGSAVIPASGLYTTRITKFDGTPATSLYGVDRWGDGLTILGSGNPGDAGVEYGVNIQLLGAGKKGVSGILKFWNAKYTPGN